MNSNERLEFLSKRLERQADYITELHERYIRKEITRKRYIEVFESADGVYDNIHKEFHNLIYVKSLENDTKR